MPLPTIGSLRMTYLEKRKEVAAEPDNRFIIEDTRGWLADILRVATLEAASRYAMITNLEKLPVVEEMKAEFDKDYPV
jgi:hypothetical protein